MLRNVGRARLCRALVGYSIALLACWFFTRQLSGQWEEYRSSLSNIDGWRIGVAIASSFLGLWLNAVSFGAASRACGVELSHKLLSGAWLGTLLAKYLPLGVGHVVGRGVLLAKHGVTARTALTVGLFEQIISLTWCAIIALFAWLFVRLVSEWRQFALISVVALFIVSTAFFRAGGISRWWAVAAAGYGAAMVPYALTYLVLVAPDDSMSFLVALFAGTIAGVMAFVVPGGIGVREVAVSALLGDVGTARVVAGIASARASIILAEVIASVVGQWWVHRQGAR